MDYQYCNSPFTYSRWKTRVVHIGQVPMGGGYPIRVQSMTNTNTLDTIATADQCCRLANAGADYVRITTPTIAEAENLAEIKKLLIQRECRIPLIADIHFNPEVAEVAARFVEKIRINPGNFLDKKSKFDYSELEYQQELEKIKKKLKKLVGICKIYKTAIRIGVNHGSLSNRIMSKYGDTPIGMVESAMEFLHIFNELDYHEIVISMKASNTASMIYSTRMLVNRMMKENMNYPLHLGVTEAGDGEDGRVKSAVGIGALLADGLGDTIRVSLAEDPEKEIPVAKALAEYYRMPVPVISAGDDVIHYSPFESNRRATYSIKKTGDTNPPVVVLDLSDIKELFDIRPEKMGMKLHNDSFLHPAENAPDFIFSGDTFIQGIVEIPQIINFVSWTKLVKAQKSQSIPLYNYNELVEHPIANNQMAMVFIREIDLKPELFDLLKGNKNILPVVTESRNASGFHEQRRIVSQMIAEGCNSPVIMFRTYIDETHENVQLFASADLGGLFIDGLADGIWLGKTNTIQHEQNYHLSFNILQASRVRISKTEFIACPSCGRTLFNLQETLAKVKESTSHLKGLKIAVMGCIVNGPGEMADADYGYVGAGSGKVSLYKKKELIKAGIDAASAVDELIKIIKENGDWK